MGGQAQRGCELELNMKRCKCEQTEKPKREDQSKNGVRVIVWRWPSGGTTVEADCQCFGSFGTVHSNMHCPMLKLARGESA